MNKKRLNDCYKCLSDLWDYANSKEKEAICTIKNMINEELKNLELKK